MKRWMIIPLLLIVLILGFIRITQTEKLEINASYYNVYQYISNARNWIKWEPDLKNAANRQKLKIDTGKTGFRITAPSIGVNLENVDLNDFAVVKTGNGKVYNCNYILMPQIKTNKTIVITIHKISLIEYIYSYFNHNESKGGAIMALKNYMEDPMLYYGFMIQKAQTPKKLYLVKQSLFGANDSYLQMHTMLTQLNNFVLKEKLKIVYPLQLQYSLRREDSVHLLVGLPVDKKVKVSNNIEYMTLPKGKVLVGYYKGTYKNKKKLYDAMHLYMNDNYIQQMVLPYEIFKNNELPGSDSTVVDMQVVIPYM